MVTTGGEMLPPAPRAADPAAEPHPNTPSRRVLALAFVAIAFAGLLGGTIGWGLMDTSCSEVPTVAQQLLESVPGSEAQVPSCGAKELAGAVGGALIAAVGVGVVTILMLRAQSEWRAHPPSPRVGPRRT